MALHCTSFLAMYAPSKYGGGVVCVCWMEGCVCVMGEVRGEVREERERHTRGEGGGGGRSRAFVDQS